MRRVAGHARDLARALERGDEAVTGTLRDMLEEMARVRPRRKRRRKPNTRDLLFQPGLAKEVA